MYVVLVISNLFEFNVVAKSNFLSQFCNSERDIVLQKSFSVFNWKDDVVVCFIDIVVCSLQAHASSLLENRGFSNFPTRIPRQAAGKSASRIIPKVRQPSINYNPSCKI